MMILFLINVINVLILIWGAPIYLCVIPLLSWTGIIMEYHT